MNIAYIVEILKRIQEEDYYYRRTLCNTCSREYAEFLIALKAFDKYL